MKNYHFDAKLSENIEDEIQNDFHGVLCLQDNNYFYGIINTDNSNAESGVIGKRNGNLINFFKFDPSSNTAIYVSAKKDSKELYKGTYGEVEIDEAKDFLVAALKLSNIEHVDMLDNLSNNKLLFGIFRPDELAKKVYDKAYDPGIVVEHKGIIEFDLRNTSFDLRNTS